MKQKIRTNVLMILFAVVLLATGCKEDVHTETTDLRLLLTTEQFSSERSLIPDSQKMVITDYHLSGTGPTDRLSPWILWNELLQSEIL